MAQQFTSEVGDQKVTKVEVMNSKGSARNQVIELIPGKESATHSVAVTGDERLVMTFLDQASRWVVCITTFVLLILGGTLSSLEPFLAGALFCFSAFLVWRTAQFPLLSRGLFLSATAVLLLAFLQTLKLPAAVADFVHQGVGTLAAALGQDTTTISLAPAETWQAAWWLSSCLMLLAALVAAPRILHQATVYPTRRVPGAPGRSSQFLSDCQVDYFADKLEVAILAVAWVVAPIALLHWVSRTQSLFGIYAPVGAFVDTPRAHWPFMNPNHLAAALNVCAFYAFGRAVQAWKLMDKDPHERAKWERDNPYLGKLNSKRMRHVMTTFTLYLICAVTVLLSASRTGLAIHGVGVLAILLLSLGGKSRRTPLIVLGFLVILATVVLSISGDAGRDFFATRVEGGLSDSGTLRVGMNWVTWEVLKAAPLFGIGLGTWHLVVPPHLDEALAVFAMNYAHNDPFQFLSEVGVVGLALLLLPVIVAGLASYRKRAVSLAPSPLHQMRRATVLVAATATPFHSLVDFPFHVPGTAILAVIALGIAFRTLSVEKAD